MARISVLMDYLEHVLFDGRAKIDGIGAIDEKRRVVEFDISGENVPKVERVVEVIREKAMHLLPLIRREITFEAEPERSGQLPLRMEPAKAPDEALEAARKAGSAPITVGQYEQLKAGLMAVEQLIGCSSGVAALINNDTDFTSWHALAPDGKHPEWLEEFYRAVKIVSD